MRICDYLTVMMPRCNFLARSRRGCCPTYVLMDPCKSGEGYLDVNHSFLSLYIRVCSSIINSQRPSHPCIPYWGPNQEGSICLLLYVLPIEMVIPLILNEANRCTSTYHVVLLSLSAQGCVTRRDFSTFRSKNSRISRISNF